MPIMSESIGRNSVALKSKDEVIKKLTQRQNEIRSKSVINCPQIDTSSRFRHMYHDMSTCDNFRKEKERILKKNQ